MSLSREQLLDLRERLGIPKSAQVYLPQVFIHGQLLGVSKIHPDIFRINLYKTLGCLHNESGELRKLLKPFQVHKTKTRQKCYLNIIQDPLKIKSVCRKCGGFGTFPCPVCNGSKKSGHRNIFSIMALKCSHCGRGGLVKCSEC